jgi:hypothetical protein
MKAVFGIALLLIAGLLLYEVVSGNASSLIQAFRGVNSSSSASNSQPKGLNTPNLQQTPSNPSIGVQPGGVG